MLKVGSRSQVFHNNANHTAGGLQKRNLKMTKDGRIVSKKASQAAKNKLKKNNCFKLFVDIAKKSKNTLFKKVPKKGTQEYKKIMKKCK
jgi:hypothetical protein